MFVDPVVLNPFPLWFKKPRFGESVFGTPMPTQEDVRTRTAALTLWSGYPEFPRDEVMNIFA